MIKSLITGVFFGGLLGSAAILIGSFIAPQPAGNTPPLPPLVELPVAAGDGEDVAPETEAVQTATVEDAEQENTGAPQPPLVDDVAVAPVADTAPADVPSTAVVDGTLAAPELNLAPQVATQSETPVLPNPQSVAPQVPATDDSPTISTEAAPLPAPEPVVVTEDPVIVAEAPQDSGTETVVEVEVTEDAPASEEVAPVTEAEASPEIPEVEETPVAEAPAVVEPAPATSDQQADEPVTVEPEQEPVLPSETDASDTQVAGQEEAPQSQEPETIVLNVISESTSALPSGTGTVRVNRRVGQPATETPSEEVTAADDLPEDAPAVLRYAAAFDNPEGRPLLSIVLVDDVLRPADPAGIAALPFPVTIAIDNASPDAPDRMQEYRAAGVEVAAMAQLPARATPSDVAVTMEAVFARMPETVFLLDTGETGLQTDRAVTAQTVQILAQQGRGLVTVSRGLNMAQRTAESADVPAAVIFRDLDESDQDARVIGRFMDQAAFRARQESGVVLLGRVRPETLEALQSFGSSGRADQVSVAPVSAILLQDVAQ